MIDREVFTTGGWFVLRVTSLKLCVLAAALLFNFAWMGMSGMAFTNPVVNVGLALVCTVLGCWAAGFVPRLFKQTAGALFAFSDAWWTSLRRHLK